MAVKFKTGLKAKLPAQRDASTLYFVQDTQELFKGMSSYSESVRVVSDLPSTPATNVLYLHEGCLKAYTGDEWAIITLPSTNFVNEESTENQVPTAKAVKDAIDTAIKNSGGSVTGDVINSVTSTKAGHITITKGSSDESIAIAGMVFNPTYDSDKRILTLPYNKVTDGSVTPDTLQINFGKDSVVKSGRYDEASKSIILTLSTNEEVTIPVDDMMVKFTGGTTKTIKVEITEGNVINANVIISDTELNALKETENGLYVKDFSSNINTLETNVATLMGDDSTEGSVLNAIKVSKEYADGLFATVAPLTWETFE